jgi:hypothetical protein
MARDDFFTRQRPKLEEEFTSLREGLGDRATRASEAGVAGAEAFDPSQAVTNFGSGFLDEAREGLGQDFESLVGESVGSGRLRTGFFQRDAGRLFQDFNRRVSNAIALQSLEASRQSLSNIQGLQRTGSDLLGQQIDVLGGAFDRSTAEENAKGGSLFGRILGGAAGLVLPGVAGKVAGKLGDKVSGALGL